MARHQTETVSRDNNLALRIRTSSMDMLLDLLLKNTTKKGGSSVDSFSLSSSQFHSNSHLNLCTLCLISSNEPHVFPPWFEKMRLSTFKDPGSEQEQLGNLAPNPPLTTSKILLNTTTSLIRKSHAFINSFSFNQRSSFFSASCFPQSSCYSWFRYNFDSEQGGQECHRVSILVDFR